MPHPDPLDHRSADHRIEPLFLRRWSPRAMSGAPLDAATVMRLIEAARWAPSANNTQEWRFIYALQGTAHFAPMLGLLGAGNQLWCARAGALMLVASDSINPYNGKAAGMHAFDAGLATQNLLLQGSAMGLVAHAMAGYDRAAARRVLALPESVHPQAMIAVGHPGEPTDLPEEKQAGDARPSGRHPLEDFTFEGKFTARS